MRKNNKLNSKNLSRMLTSFSYKELDGVVSELINRKELQGYLPNILKTLKTKEAKEKSFESINVESATELEMSFIKDIIKNIETKTKVKIKNLEEKLENVKLTVNPKMIAGVKVKIGQISVDSSLKNILKNTLQKK